MKSRRQFVQSLSVAPLIPALGDLPEKPAWYKPARERHNPNVWDNLNGKLVLSSDPTQDWASKYTPKAFLERVSWDYMYLYTASLPMGGTRTLASHLWDQGVDLRPHSPTCEIEGVQKTVNLGTLLDWTVDIRTNPSRIFREIYDTMIEGGTSHLRYVGGGRGYVQGPARVVYDLSFQDHVRGLHDYLTSAGHGYEGLSNDLDVIHQTMLRWDSKVVIQKFTENGERKFQTFFAMGDEALSGLEGKSYTRGYMRQEYDLTNTIEVVIHQSGDPLNTLPDNLKRCPAQETPEAIKRLAQNHRKFLADPDRSFAMEFWAKYL